MPQHVDRIRVILSRKGIDSQFGNYPSPILPDGKLISIPIPDKTSATRYFDLKYPGFEIWNYARLMYQLGLDTLASKTTHFDPDLHRPTVKRRRNWLPMFGQSGVAQSHLEKQGVGEVGDLFLFFGWFRATEYPHAVLRYIAQSPDIHLLFGYLQVGEKIRVGQQTILKPWMEQHPHADDRHRDMKNNTLYVARKHTSWNEALPGAGMFRFDPRLVLTKEGESRSVWNLPDFFKKLHMSYHNSKNWAPYGFRAATRGQEFVVQDNERVQEWAKEIVEIGMSKHRK